MFTLRKIWKVVYFVNWAIILSFWALGSGPDLFIGGASALIALGRLAGLAAANMILTQFFFMGRTPYLEAAFGLDRLSRIHHKNGTYGLVVLLFHPVLILFGYASAAGIGIIAQEKSFLFDYSYFLVFSSIALILFIVVVGTSITIVRSRLRYESWYFVHLIAYLAVFFSFFHQRELGSDIISRKFFYNYWLLLYIFVFGNHLVFRFIRPVYRTLRHGFYVAGLKRENYNTISVYIGGRGLDRFPIKPGQFMIHRFLTRKLWWQAHPFSLSFMPDGKQLRITVKELGDFTKQIKDIPIGTKMLIDGPYGVFTELFSISDKILMIAGGIGITPIRSLIEQMSRHKKDIMLLYSNRTEQDIVFKQELNQIAANYGAKITHVITEDKNYEGERGLLTADKINSLVPDLLSREIFLCGPPPMMDAIIKGLQKFNIPISKIHFEKFSLG